MPSNLAEAENVKHDASKAFKFILPEVRLIIITGLDYSRSGETERRSRILH